MHLFDAAGLSVGDYEQILSFLREGGVIGFPTDTAYGLGADPSNESAVRRIFQIKGRPETKPVLLLVNSIPMARTVATLSETAVALAERFWPGALTMILPALNTVPAVLTAGTARIGVRWANAAFALTLLPAWGRPITATSANLSGAPAAATAEEVRRQLGDRLEMLIDGGSLPAPGGSTLLDLTQEPPLVLREGPVAFAELSAALKGRICGLKQTGP